MARFDQCDSTCTTDCGHCKGAGKPPTFRVYCPGCRDTVPGLYEGTVAWWIENHAALAHPFWDLKVVERNVVVEPDGDTP